MEGVDAIVHAGAIPWDREDGSQVVSTNVLGTWNVLQAAVEAGVERFVGSRASTHRAARAAGVRPPTSPSTTTIRTIP